MTLEPKFCTEIETRVNFNVATIEKFRTGKFIRIVDVKYSLMIKEFSIADKATQYNSAMWGVEL